MATRQLAKHHQCNGWLLEGQIGACWWDFVQGFGISYQCVCIEARRLGGGATSSARLLFDSIFNNNKSMKATEATNLASWRAAEMPMLMRRDAGLLRWKSISNDCSVSWARMLDLVLILCSAHIQSTPKMVVHMNVWWWPATAIVAQSVVLAKRAAFSQRVRLLAMPLASSLLWMSIAVCSYVHL